VVQKEVAEGLSRDTDGEKVEHAEGLRGEPPMLNCAVRLSHQHPLNLAQE